MKVSFEYTALQVLNITNDTTDEAFQKNYLEKIKDENKDSNEGKNHSRILADFTVKATE